jgi:hypothetical protein
MRKTKNKNDMKKLFKNLMFLALTAITFTACEDVPSPYDIPGTGKNIPGSGQLEGATGEGTLANPFNAVAALNYGNKLAPGEESTDYVYVKGIVVSIKEEFTTQYGSGTFYISDDGTAANRFYAYRVYYLGNQKFTKDDEQVKPGDVVVLCAKITNYNGTIETVQNKGFVYELNGKNRGGAVEPSTPSADPTGEGTLASPYNVAAVLKYINTLGADTESPKDIYVKGKISQIKEEFSTQYGNGTFYISDDGTTSNEFYAFRIMYLGNKKFAAGNTQVKAGDEVIICGKVVNFKGNTPETVQNKAYLYSLNGTTASQDTPTPEPTEGEPKGSGTQADPFNVLAALNYTTALGADKESDKEVYIKGKVSTIKFNYVADNYGNATFYISDDATTNNEFYCYRVLYIGNQKYTSGALLNVGDEVVICGKVVNYKGNTPETVQNKAYLVSLTAGSGSEEPEPVAGGDVTKTVSGTTVTLVNTKATASTNSVTVDFNNQGWNNATAPSTVTLADGTTIEFGNGENTSNSPMFYTATKGVRVYAKNTIDINGSKPVAKVVMECDSYNGTDYVGNSLLTATVSGNKFTIINDHTEAKGGVQLRVKTMTITYAQ